MQSNRFAASMLVIGCVLFGLGSLIVKFVPVGAYAIAFWRLLIASGIFGLLMKLYRKPLPKQPKALFWAIASGIFLAFDLAFWHESIYAVGPGISTLLNSLQIFFLAFIGWLFFQEQQSKLQLASLLIAIVGVVLIASPELQHNIEELVMVFLSDYFPAPASPHPWHRFAKYTALNRFPFFHSCGLSVLAVPPH